MKKQLLSVIPDEIIIDRIYLIRSQKVMLDRDLATLYGVETKVLKQAVKRNLMRFPIDFMFEMSNEEFELRLSQKGSLFNLLKISLLLLITFRI